MKWAILVHLSIQSFVALDPPEIEFVHDSDRSHVVVRNLSQKDLQGFRDLASDEARRRKMRVYVKPRPGGKITPMLGDYQVADNGVVFLPSFPFAPRATYVAEFHLADRPDPLQREFRVNAAPRPPANVAAVYPTSDVLPENQLKFYLHFSQPMSRGQAYQRVHLIGQDGREIELPFLELGEELWDPSGKRFTLFFDPGRIKRGLKPREEEGPALEAGKSYTLVIDQAWLDANRRPLKTSFRKSFRVGEPDDTEPDPKKWSWKTPKPGTKNPLEIRFDEPMDRGMVERVLVVQDQQGQEILGDVSITQSETVWQFRPKKNWQVGRYRLQVDTAVEDRAGNSIAKPFEVDVFDKVEPRLKTNLIRLPFRIEE